MVARAFDISLRRGNSGSFLSRDGGLGMGADWRLVSIKIPWLWLYLNLYNLSTATEEISRDLMSEFDT